jgi:hypothetical protein
VWAVSATYLVVLEVLLSQLMNEAVLPALNRLNLQYLSGAQTPALVVPVALPLPIGGAALLMVEADDERDEVMLHAHMCTPPSGRRAGVALILAELNTRYRSVTLSMTRDGEVQIDTCVDLTGLPEVARPNAVAIGAARLLHALEQTYGPVLQSAMQSAKRAPRIEREVNQVLRDLEA